MSRRRAVVHFPNASPREVDPERIDELLKDPHCLVWLDVQSPSIEDVQLLEQEFGFNELVIEDALERGQRAKVEEYPDYYFIVLYSAGISENEHVEAREIHCFWGANYLVTLHTGAVTEIDSAVDRWARSEDHRRYGIAYQVYALLDSIVDSYFPALDSLAARIDDLEERLLSVNGSIIGEVLALRREVLEARRLLAPSRDVLNGLIRRDVPIFPQSLTWHLLDVHDHAIRAIDNLDLQRELLASAIEAHLSVTNNRLNKSMLRLTGLTVCLALPVVVAGIYGMNYNLFPPQDGPSGFWIALGMMAGLTLAIAVVFKRVGWF